MAGQRCPTGDDRAEAVRSVLVHLSSGRDFDTIIGHLEGVWLGTSVGSSPGFGRRFATLGPSADGLPPQC